MRSVDRPSLSRSLATPDAKHRYVRTLFATIADRYDLITRLLSYGQDRAWKVRLVELSAASPRTRALDLACGTGDIAFWLAAPGAHVIGPDLPARMLQPPSAQIPPQPPGALVPRAKKGRAVPHPPLAPG